MTTSLGPDDAIFKVMRFSGRAEYKGCIDQLSKPKPNRGQANGRERSSPTFHGPDYLTLGWKRSLNDRSPFSRVLGIPQWAFSTGLVTLQARGSLILGNSKYLVDFAVKFATSDTGNSPVRKRLM
jgi:hypothetical protein